VAVVGPFWVVAATLIASGVAKLASPSAVGGALGRLHLPSSRTAAQGLGLAEVGLGALAIAFGGPVASAALAAWYLLLALAAALLLRGGAASCGCFGQASAPPSWLHVALDLVAAAIAAAATAAVTPAATDVLAELGWLSAVFLPFAVLGTVAFVAAFDLLPRVLAEADRPHVAEFGIRR
jgi:Methylamine utilisation protein MauE